MAKARKKSTKKKSSVAGTCRTLRMGKAGMRTICWGMNGKIKSNKPAKKR
jgi:hypothetical protein